MDCIHGPISPTGMGSEVEDLRKAERLEGQQLYIDPRECIDCAACAPECPVDAIYFDGEVPEGLQHFIAKNYAFFGLDAPGGAG